MHTSYLPFIILALVLYSVETGMQEAPIKCPRYCSCFVDSASDMRTVSCVAKRLDSVDLTIPKRAQMLDLSNNSIYHLEDRCFMSLGLKDLVRVNLKFNSIRTIGLHSFAGLTSLEAVDLSSNNLYKILPWTFHDNGDLKFISLSNNPLGHVLQSGPLLDVPSLEVLHLSGCHFAHFSDDAFSALPNLRRLDISDNQIISINIYSLQFLYNLEILDITKNPWRCDTNLLNLKDFLLTSSSQLVGSSCEEPEKAPVMFEKIISVAGETYPDYDDVSSSSDETEEELDGKHAMCECRDQELARGKNNTPKEGLPPAWLLLVGFQLGVCATVVFGYVYVYCSGEHKKYSRLEPTGATATAETEVCSAEVASSRPDTPPPAYADLHFT